MSTNGHSTSRKCADVAQQSDDEYPYSDTDTDTDADTNTDSNCNTYCSDDYRCNTHDDCCDANCNWTSIALSQCWWTSTEAFHSRKVLFRKCQICQSLRSQINGEV